MIVVDSSAIVAILESEPDAAVYIKALKDSAGVAVSAFSAHETGVVMCSRRGLVGIETVWQFLTDVVGADIVPFDDVQARLSTMAFQRYGKGMGSVAKLNLADCASYALAKSMNRPLLFKGNDFIHTDVQRCL